jgi:hypothetical protein
MLLIVELNRKNGFKNEFEFGKKRLLIITTLNNLIVILTWIAMALFDGVLSIIICGILSIVFVCFSYLFFKTTFIIQGKSYSTIKLLFSVITLIMFPLGIYYLINNFSSSLEQVTNEINAH